MKNINLILLLLFTFISQAQELDQEFLNSLPDDIKKDIEKRNSVKSTSVNNVYRPYLYSSKLQRSEELINLKDRLEKDLIELEKRLNSDEKLNLDNDLKLYGSDFFNTFQTSFMPINEPNPDSGYILDTGDVLTIQLVGQDDFIEDFIINRDGAINLPNIGKIFIAGLSLGDASKMITYKINEALLGSDVYINLSQIRDINILVSGNAKNPGIYTLNGNSNILHAISSAGGISEFGSLREIKLLRNNEVIETLDLYDLLINGKYNLTKRLRSGDVIFVEAKKIIVTIDGAVNRPGKYEVFQDQKLDSLIKYANGLKKLCRFRKYYFRKSS